MKPLKISFLLLMLLSISLCWGQSPCILSSGQSISFEKGVRPHWYYYLPAYLRIATKSDGTPEVSVMKIQDSVGAPIEGLLIHILLQWGITVEHETELTSCLREEVDSSAVITGAVLITVPEGHEYLEMKGNNRELVELLMRNLKSQGKTPTLPHSKTALSFFFHREDAQTLLRLMSNASSHEVVMEARLEISSGDTLALQWDLGTFLNKSLSSP